MAFQISLRVAWWWHQQFPQDSGMHLIKTHRLIEVQFLQVDTNLIFTYSRKGIAPQVTIFCFLGRQAPSFWISPPSFFSFISKFDVIWYRTSFQSLWVSCRGCISSQLLTYPQLLAEHHEQKRLWLYVSPSQQQFKHECAITTFPIPSPKLSIMSQASIKKINSIPDKTRTIAYSLRCHQTLQRTGSFFGRMNTGHMVVIIITDLLLHKVKRN